MSFYFIKTKFISKLLKIREFIKEKLGGKDPKYTPSKIIELDTIAQDFNNLFRQHTAEKEKFKQLLTHSSDAIFIMDIQGNLLEYSKETKRLLGYSTNEMKELCIADWDKNFPKNSLLKMLQDQPLNKIMSLETIHQRKDGSFYDTSITSVKILLQNQEMIYSSARDITQEKKQQRLLTEYISMIDQNILTSSTDLHGVITEVSSAFCSLSGYSKEELVGSNHNIVRHNEMPSSTFEEIWKTITQNNTWYGEIKNRKKNGDYYWVDSTIMPIFDENKNKIGYRSIRQDITDKKHIEEISKTDPLTGIFNRRYFDEIFLQILNSARRDSKTFSFLILDIDHFKQYNDTYGHQLGDEVLKKVSNAIKNSLHRADDYCFRLGGEEFGVIFKSDTSTPCKAFADNIRKNIEELQIEHKKNSASPFITASLGLITITPDETHTLDKLYKQADDLLYKAKQNGRNQVVSNF